MGSSSWIDDGDKWCRELLGAGVAASECGSQAGGGHPGCVFYCSFVFLCGKTCVKADSTVVCEAGDLSVAQAYISIPCKCCLRTGAPGF